MAGVFEEIYEVVRRIPKGRVLTYGLISAMIGGRMSAQGVGWALKALGSAKNTATASTKSKTAASAKKPSTKTATKKESPYNSSNVPWQRVVNSQGGTSTHKVGLPPDLQRTLLEKEGVVFNDENLIDDLDTYLWKAGMAKYITETKPGEVIRKKASTKNSETESGSNASTQQTTTKKTSAKKLSTKKITPKKNTSLKDLPVKEIPKKKTTKKR